jgi:hypothetical protein
MLSEGDLPSPLIARTHFEPLRTCQIEAPYLAPPILTAEEESVNAADVNLHGLNMSAAKEYHSIGELYTELEHSKPPSSLC